MPNAPACCSSTSHTVFSAALRFDAHRQHHFLHVAAEVVDRRVQVQIDRRIRRIRMSRADRRRLERNVLHVHRLRRELRCIRVGCLAVGAAGTSSTMIQILCRVRRYECGMREAHDAASATGVASAGRASSLSSSPERSSAASSS